jgi:hypothetical protein
MNGQYSIKYKYILTVLFLMCHEVGGATSSTKPLHIYIEDKPDIWYIKKVMVACFVSPIFYQSRACGVALERTAYE